jgi:hypothetical protein
VRMFWGVILHVLQRSNCGRYCHIGHSGACQSQHARQVATSQDCEMQHAVVPSTATQHWSSSGAAGRELQSCWGFGCRLLLVLLPGAAAAGAAAAGATSSLLLVVLLVSLVLLLLVG